MFLKRFIFLFPLFFSIGLLLTLLKSSRRHAFSFAKRKGQAWPKEKF